jgi:hypothetical protein
VLAAGTVVFVALVSAWVWMPEDAEPERRPSTGITMAPASALIAAPAAVRPAKVVYRHSVLPGGVGNAMALRSALAHDPVAAAHYAGFNVDAARQMQVERPRMVHVSYRIGDKIYWTRKPVRLELGETLLSDGEHLARARCGNRISDEAQAPVLVNEPAPEVLEMAYVSADPLIDDAPSAGSPRANGDETAHPAEAQQAARTRGLSSFATVPPMVLQALPTTYSPTRVLAFADAPGTSPAPAQTPPPPVTPGSSPPKSPVTGSPVPASPVPGTPVPGTPVPESIVPEWPVPGSPTMASPTPPNPPPSIPQAPTPIPEPGSAGLLALGAAIVALLRRFGPRRRQR